MTDSGTMKDTMRTTSSSAKMKAVANEPRAKEKVKDPGKKQKHIDNADADEPSALPVSSGGSLARRYEYTMFYFLAITSWCLEITAGVVGSIYGGDSHVFIGTVTAFLVTHWAAFLQTCWMMATASRHTLGDRMAYLNLACRFQRLCAPTALIGMVIWAVAYRFKGKASSNAYWIIFLVVWIINIVVCLMNVYNNITWESDLLYQIAPEYPQGNFWLAVLGIRSMCRYKHPHRDIIELPPKQPDRRTVEEAEEQQGLDREQHH